MAVKVDFQVRPADSMDQRQIANLIHFESYVHRHLDWRNPLDWIGVPPYLVAEQVTTNAPRRWRGSGCSSTRTGCR